jgi:HSP90 family molecular chaperone
MADIKSVNTIEEIREIRINQVEAEKAGGDHDGIQRILTEDMYSNPLRFIDELLQNAQDAARKAAKNFWDEMPERAYSNTEAIIEEFTKQEDKRKSTP